MIDGVSVEIGPQAVWVRSAEPLRVVASAFVGGGLTVTRHIVNMHWPHEYQEGLDLELQAFARRLGIAEPFVGLMTAAPTHEAVSVTERLEALTATAVVTVGIGTLESAGISPPRPWSPGTINTVVLLDACLEPAAAVNGVITATEAKAGALVEAGLRTGEGVPATGTVTDAVVVAWTERGLRLPYLGPAAPGGWLLARAVRQAVAMGLKRS